MNLEPFHPAQHSNTELYTYRDDEGRWLAKRYLLDGGLELQTRESVRLKHWKAHGFAVPDICDSESAFFPDAYNILSFIDGVTLADRLSSMRGSDRALLQVIHLVLVEHSTRHALALKNDDELLVHPDPSPNNIIVENDILYYIDFENSLKERSLDELVSLEIERFVLRLLRGVGSQYLNRVVDLLVLAYADQTEILQGIVRRHKVSSIVRWVKRTLRLRARNEVSRADLSAVIHSRLSSHLAG